MGPSSTPLSPADVIRVEDEHYILASSSLADERTRILKQGETFAVFDRFGDIHRVGRGQQGLYQNGTRHLSRFELRLNGHRPMLLSSTVTEENALLAVDLTNPELRLPGGTTVPQDTIHIIRSAVLWNSACRQRLRVQNYALERVELPLNFLFEADFADIFEVRGMERARCSGKGIRSKIILSFILVQEGIVHVAIALRAFHHQAGAEIVAKWP